MVCIGVCNLIGFFLFSAFKDRMDVEHEEVKDAAKIVAAFVKLEVALRMIEQFQVCLGRKDQKGFCFVSIGSPVLSND